MHWGTNEVLAACAAVTVLGAVLGLLWKGLRRVTRFFDQWDGTDEHPGVIKRLTVLEDIITAQLKPNGGASIYDKVTRIDDALPAAPTAIHIHTDGGSA